MTTYVSIPDLQVVLSVDNQTDVPSGLRKAMKNGEVIRTNLPGGTGVRLINLGRVSSVEVSEVAPPNETTVVPFMDLHLFQA
jgi:hypothetical protein